MCEYSINKHHRWNTHILFFVQLCIQRYPPSNNIICSWIPLNKIQHLKPQKTLIWPVSMSLVEVLEAGHHEPGIQQTWVSQSRKSLGFSLDTLLMLHSFHSLGPNMAPPDSICRFFHTWQETRQAVSKAPIRHWVAHLLLRRGRGF